MLGKESINHNTRKFKAENIDAERTGFNISYIDKGWCEFYWTDNLRKYLYYTDRLL